MPLCCCGGRVDDAIIAKNDSQLRRLQSKGVVRCPPPRLRAEEQTVPVLLNVYSLVESNKRLTKIGMGVFHTSIVIYGIEWSYGEVLDNPDVSGLFCVHPGQAAGSLYKTIRLGVTTKSPTQVDTILHRLENEWRSCDYHILHHNCNNFAQAFCDLLSTIEKLEVPAWCNRAARVGDRIVPKKLATKVQRMFDEEPPKAKKPSPKSNVNEIPASVIPRGWFLHPSVAQRPRYTNLFTGVDDELTTQGSYGGRPVTLHPCDDSAPPPPGYDDGVFEQAVMHWSIDFASDDQAPPIPLTDVTAPPLGDDLVPVASTTRSTEEQDLSYSSGAHGRQRRRYSQLAHAGGSTCPLDGSSGTDEELSAPLLSAVEEVPSEQKMSSRSRRAKLSTAQRSISKSSIKSQRETVVGTPQPEGHQRSDSASSVTTHPSYQVFTVSAGSRSPGAVSVDANYLELVSPITDAMSARAKKASNSGTAASPLNAVPLDGAGEEEKSEVHGDGVSEGDSAGHMVPNADEQHEETNQVSDADDAAQLPATTIAAAGRALSRHGSDELTGENENEDTSSTSFVENQVAPSTTVEKKGSAKRPTAVDVERQFKQEDTSAVSHTRSLKGRSEYSDIFALHALEDTEGYDADVNASTSRSSPRSPAKRAIMKMVAKRDKARAKVRDKYKAADANEKADEAVEELPSLAAMGGVAVPSETERIGSQEQLSDTDGNSSKSGTPSPFTAAVPTTQEATATFMQFARPLSAAVVGNTAAAWPQEQAPSPSAHSAADVSRTHHPVGDAPEVGAVADSVQESQRHLSCSNSQLEEAVPTGALDRNCRATALLSHPHASEQPSELPPSTPPNEQGYGGDDSPSNGVAGIPRDSPVNTGGMLVVEDSSTIAEARLSSSAGHLPRPRALEMTTQNTVSPLLPKEAFSPAMPLGSVRSGWVDSVAAKVPTSNNSSPVTDASEKSHLKDNRHPE